MPASAGPAPAAASVAAPAAPLPLLLVIRPLPLPLNSGDRVFPGHLTRAAADAGAAVTVRGMATGPRPDDVLGAGIDWVEVTAEPRGSLKAATMSLPLVAAKSSPPPVREAFRRLV